MTGTMEKFPLAGCITCRHLQSNMKVKTVSNLGNEGKLHFYAMFVFICINAHQLKLPSLQQLVGDLPVDGEVAEGCLVGGALSEGAAGEPHVVTGPEDEDGLDGGRVQLFEAVGRGRSRVAVPGVGTDDGPGWVRDLVSSREPAGEISVQVSGVSGVPRVGVTGSPGRHGTYNQRETEEAGLPAETN